MEPIETVKSGDFVMALIIRAGWSPNVTTFLTPDDYGQQMGMIVYGAGKEVQPHLHLPVTRQVEGTSECIVVRKGRCALDLYDSGKKLVGTRELNTGDIVLLVHGGHGFRMHEDTVLFEVKQGPFMGTADKEKFNRS